MKIRIQIIGILLTLMLLVQLTPMTVHAAAGTPKLVVDGIDMLSSVGEVTVGAGTASYNADENKLTINNITTRTNRTETDTDPLPYIAIDCENMEGLTIVSIGTNTLDSVPNQDSRSIRIISSDVKLCGEGTIKAIKGISVLDGSLTIQEGVIDSTVTNDGEQFEGIAVDGSKVVVGGNAAVTVQGAKYKPDEFYNAVSLRNGSELKIAEQGKLVVNCGVMGDSVQDGYGISDNGTCTLTMSDSASLEVYGENTIGIHINKLYMSGESQLKVAIDADASGNTYNAGAICVDGIIECRDSSKLIVNSALVGIITPGRADAPVEVDINVFDSAEVQLETNAKGWPAVYSQGKDVLTVTLQGNSVLTVEEEPGLSVYVDNLILNDNAEVSVTNREGSNALVYVRDSVNLNSGKLNVEGNISAGNDVTVIGGTLKTDELKSQNGKISILDGNHEITTISSNEAAELMILVDENCKDILYLDKLTYLVGETVTVEIQGNYYIEKILVNGVEAENGSFVMPNEIVRITAEGILETADYSKVDEAIAKIPVDLSGYTEESVKAVIDARNMVVRNRPLAEQATVDAWAQEIENALRALEKNATNNSTEASSPNAENGTEKGNTEASFPNAEAGKSTDSQLQGHVPATGDDEPVLFAGIILLLTLGTAIMFSRKK